MVETQESSEQQVSDYVELVKEKLTASILFAGTCETYLDDIADIYSKTYYEYVQKFGCELAKLGMSEAERQTICLEIIDVIENCLAEETDNFENAIDDLVKVPKHVNLPGDDFLQPVMQNYSREEDAKLDWELEEFKRRIDQKKCHFKLLRDRLASMAQVKQIID